MASIEAASTLLTAISIIVAGSAILLRQLTDTIRLGQVYRAKLIGALAGSSFMFIIISLIVSVLYLQAAEYPDGLIGGVVPPRSIFNLAILQLLFGIISGTVAFFLTIFGMAFRND